MVERGPLGARARLGPRRLGVLAGQRSLAVAVRHHAVGNAGHEPHDVDAQDVPGLRARHLDRPGDDVRPRPVEVVLEVGLRDRARVTQDLVLADPLAGEVAIGIPALVLEMPSPRGTYVPTRRPTPACSTLGPGPSWGPVRDVRDAGGSQPRRRDGPRPDGRAGPQQSRPPIPSDRVSNAASGSLSVLMLAPGDRAREPRRRGAGRNRLRP